MAPTENIRLPFRWQFIPLEDERDGSVCWSWKAFTQTGDLALQSERSFDTLTDCMQDARQHGYGKA
jgi:hypothetical protein